MFSLADLPFLYRWTPRLCWQQSSEISDHLWQLFSGVWKWDLSPLVMAIFIGLNQQISYGIFFNGNPWFKPANFGFSPTIIFRHTQGNRNPHTKMEGFPKLAVALQVLPNPPAESEEKEKESKWTAEEFYRQGQGHQDVSEVFLNEWNIHKNATGVWWNKWV